MIFPSHLSMTEYSLYSSVCINLRSRPAAVSTYNVVRKVYGTLLHRLRYLPYSSGAPFTVVCPTGKYCNVLREIHPSVVCNVPSTGAMVYPPLQCSVCCCNVSAAPSTALHCNTMHPLPLQRNMAFFHCNTFSSFMQHNSVPHCNTCLPPLQCNWVSRCNTLVPLQRSASTGKYCCTLCAIIRLPLQCLARVATHLSLQRKSVSPSNTLISHCNTPVATLYRSHRLKVNSQ